MHFDELGGDPIVLHRRTQFQEIFQVTKRTLHFSPSKLRIFYNSDKVWRELKVVCRSGRQCNPTPKLKCFGVTIALQEPLRWWRRRRRFSSISLCVGHLRIMTWRASWASRFWICELKRSFNWLLWRSPQISQITVNQGYMVEVETLESCVSCTTKERVSTDNHK